MCARKKSKAKRWIIISIILLAIIAVAAALLMRPKSAAYESVDAKTADITTHYSFSGNVDAKNRQTVVSDQAMQISKINVKEGDTVKKDAVLIKSTAGNEIQSKISGEVVSVKVEENAQVMAGTELVDIVDYDNLEINVKVDEYDMAALAKGKETAVKIGALDKEIKGTISSISKEGQITNGVTYFMATIDLEKDESIKIGMSAEVTLLNSSAAGVVTLPMTVIQFDENNKPYVLKKDENGAPVKTEITTGINDGTIVEIKSGVKAGETILYQKVAATTQGMGFTGGDANTSGTSGGNDG